MAHRPVRINRCIFKYRNLLVAVTVQDQDFREAKQNRAYGDPFEVIGNLVGMEEALKLGRTTTGDQLPTAIHAVFRMSDLERQGVMIRKGDRLIELMLVGLGGAGF